MVRIGKPYVEQYGDKSRLCAKLDFGNMEKVLWFEVDKEYEPFLTTDRSDAFVVSLLSAAMRAGEDIVCEAPVTRRLAYQLNHYLIPTLSKNTKRYLEMKVLAEPAPAPAYKGDAVGVGWTGGVDSFYTFMNHSPTSDSLYKISHLLVANIGTFEEGELEETLEIFMQRARLMAETYQMKVVGINSNIHLILDENYLSVAGFRLPGAVLALQGLFRIFLHSSGFSFSQFRIDEADSSCYELLLMSCFETDSTTFYSAGSEVPRIKKMEELADYPPAWKFLHTCIHPQDGNCGKCAKCQWMLAELYAFGKLDNFKDIVDIEYFLQNKDLYIKKLAVKTDPFAEEAYEMLLEKGLVPQDIQRLSKVVKAGKKVYNA